MRKICGRVYNMCLSGFIVETSMYNSPRTNQGPLRRILAFWGQDYLGSVHLRKETTKRVWIDGAPMPSTKTYPFLIVFYLEHSLNSSMKCSTKGGRGRRLTNGPLVEVSSVRPDFCARFKLVPIN